MFDTVRSGRSIIYIERPHGIISKDYIIVFLSLEIDFVIADGVEPGEMLHFGRPLSVFTEVDFAAVLKDEDALYFLDYEVLKQRLILCKINVRGISHS